MKLRKFLISSLQSSVANGSRTKVFGEDRGGVRETMNAFPNFSHISDNDDGVDDKMAKKKK